MRYTTATSSGCSRRRGGRPRPGPPGLRSTASIVARCRSTGADVLVVVEGVVGVVLGLDLGESPVDVIAVGLSNAAGVVVGIKEVDVDAVGAVGLEGPEEPPRPGGLGRGVLSGLLR